MVEDEQPVQRARVGSVVRWIAWTGWLVTLSAVVNMVVNLPGVVGLEVERPSATTQVLTFALSTALVACLALLVYCVTARALTTTVVMVLIGLVTAFADARKLEFRFEPLYPTDLRFVRDAPLLVDAVGAVELVLFAGTCLLIAGTGVLAHRVLRRSRVVSWFGEPLRGRPVLRSGCIVVCLGVLWTALQFNAPGNPVRNAYEAAGVSWVGWQQTRNYEANGFVASFLYNLVSTPMAEPSGYSADTMHRIAERYAARAETLNRAAEQRPVNVVMVLSESFIDPLVMRRLRLDEDPLRYTRALLRTTTSGRMYSPGYGGGTANIEFAALTGQAQALYAPQMSTPYQQLLPAYDAFPALPELLRKRGYRTVALHPYKPEMYMRDAAYPTLGFDEFRSGDDVVETSRTTARGFRSDRATLAAAVQEIRETDEPVFVNVVTMQNHIPYAGGYSDPVAVRGAASPAEAQEVGSYARGLSLSDAAVQELVGRLRALSEPTVVLYYGDHHPAIWSAATRAAEQERVVHETPFFVWANFGEPMPDPAHAVSPAYFGELALTQAGIPLPPFYALLADLRTELPVIAPGLLTDRHGRVVTPRTLSPRARRLLRDYRLVQYDLSVGNGYAADELFYAGARPVRRD